MSFDTLCACTGVMYGLISQLIIYNLVLVNFIIYSGLRRDRSDSGIGRWSRGPKSESHNARPTLMKIYHGKCMVYHGVLKQVNHGKPF